MTGEVVSRTEISACVVNQHKNYEDHDGEVKYWLFLAINIMKLLILQVFEYTVPGKHGTTVMSWQQVLFSEKKQSRLHEHSIGEGPTVQALSSPTQHSVKPASTHEAPKSPFPFPLPLPLPLPLPTGGMSSAVKKKLND